MRAVLGECRAEFLKQILGFVGGEASLPQARDKLLLPHDMLLALGDVMFGHLDVRRSVGHGR